MPIHLGDLYRCSDDSCGFEFLVVHESSKRPKNEPGPHCYCGQLLLRQT